MDRHRLSRGRGSAGQRGPSSNYSRSFESSHHNSSHSSHDYSRSDGYNSREFSHYSTPIADKRKYDVSSQDYRRSFSHHSTPATGDRRFVHEDHARKRFRSEADHYSEGRSNHHRTDYHNPPSSERDRYHSSHNDGASSHDILSRRPERRVDERPSRRPIRGNGPSMRSVAGSSRRGGAIAPRIRGRGGRRGAKGLQPMKANAQITKRTTPSAKKTEEKAAEIKHEADKSVPGDGTNKDQTQNEGQQASEKPYIRPESRKSTRDEVEDMDKDEVELTLTEEDRAAVEGVDEEMDHSKTENNDKEKSNTLEGEAPKREESTPKSIPPSSPKRKSVSGSQDLPQNFIRLQCPHCHQRSVTFREYISHLSSKRHAESLRKISVQHRMSLAKLRTRQRKEQLQIEAQSFRPSHSTRMNFCAICKLSHSESRPNHETTELHKIIKNFLMPYCPICRTNFKSRMLYEKHVATLTHIKNKANMEKACERRREEKRQQDKCEDSDEDFVKLNLDNFMILDAVGSVDGDGERRSLEDISVGEEFVKKVEVFYCDLCQRYLNRTEPLEKVVELHCRSRAHYRAMEERQGTDKSDRSDEKCDDVDDELEGEGIDDMDKSLPISDEAADTENMNGTGKTTAAVNDIVSDGDCGSEVPQNEANSTEEAAQKSEVNTIKNISQISAKEQPDDAKIRVEQIQE